MIASHENPEGRPRGPRSWPDHARLVKTGSVMDSKKAADDWTSFDERQLAYHTTQWKNPKESTKAFEAFIAHRLDGSRRIIDLGAGTGAATAFLAGRHPATDFVAADYVSDFLRIGENVAKNQGLDNLAFRQLDWMEMPETTEFDGVVSLQTLSWLPEPVEPLVQVFTKLKPEWLAITSLFYEGDISCTISVHEHVTGQRFFYNVYAIPEIRRVCAEHGYHIASTKRFEIGIDLEKPDNLDAMGTYTRRVVTESSDTIERLQISGPILMPWHMLLIERS